MSGGDVSTSLELAGKSSSSFKYSESCLAYSKCSITVISCNCAIAVMDRGDIDKRGRLADRYGVKDWKTEGSGKNAPEKKRLNTSRIFILNSAMDWVGPHNSTLLC